MVLPLHGPQGGNSAGTKRISAVGNLPAEIGVAVAVGQPVDPRPVLVLTPERRIVARDGLRKAPDLLDDLRRVCPLRFEFLPRRLRL